MGSLKIVTKNLLKYGLLLQQDKSLPNVVSIVTGESLKMSWWSHPLAGKIFEVLGQLSGNPDVIATKMVGGKVTFVHRRIWPEVLAVSRSMEEWQFDGLSQKELDLYREIEAGELAEARGASAKKLEQRLLIRSWQEHVESGEHRTKVESWTEWAKREGVASKTSVRDAKASLEKVVQEFGGGRELLPWGKAESKQM
jgi:hypothetical protein